jgi:hypothetical protein
MEQLKPRARQNSAINKIYWIAGRLGPFGADVTSAVPGGFDTSVRILHPAE